MSQTVAEASASYRKRQRDKLKRYEGALRAIANCQSHHANDVVAVARAALNADQNSLSRAVGEGVGDEGRGR